MRLGHPLSLLLLAQTVRRYSMCYIPPGFWPRLVARLIAFPKRALPHDQVIHQYGHVIHQYYSDVIHQYGHVIHQYGHVIHQYSHVIPIVCYIVLHDFTQFYSRLLCYFVFVRI